MSQRDASLQIMPSVWGKLVWPYALHTYRSNRTLTAAKKNETTISQMTSLVKAPKAWPKVSVLVVIAVVTARNAQAPVGKGSNTKPASGTMSVP